MIDQEIARRMDAYRGNPQALMQRYQQNQQLLDLLALQKLKSEKEAAMRSMQMAQGADAGGLPTVAEQREQELLNMTKQELAGQVGGIAQQRQQAMQSNLQKLMGGIAQAPGAQNVMTPKAMAAGGIVAFAEGGSPDPEAGLSMAERAERQRLLKGSIYSRRYGAPPEERGLYLREQAEDIEPGRAYQEAQYAAEAARPIPPEVLAPPGRAARRVATEAAARSLREGVADAREEQALRFPEPVAPKAFPTESRQEVAAGPAARTAPSQPSAPTTAPAPAPQDEFTTMIKSGIGSVLGDPMEEFRRLQAAYPQMTPEEKAAAERRMQRRREMVTEQFDPRRQGIEQLIRMGTTFARGLTPGVGAGMAAEAGTNYAAQQRAAQRQAEEGLLGLEEKAAAEDLAARRAAAGMGAEAYKAATQQKTAGLTAGAGLIGQELTAEANRLNAEARRAEIAANREIRSRDDLWRTRTALAERMDKIKADMQSAHEKAMGARLQLARQNPDRPENRQLLEADARALSERINTALSETQRVIGELDKKLGIPETAPAATKSPSVSTAGFKLTGVK